MDSLGLKADGRLELLTAGRGGVEVAGVRRSGTRLARILAIGGAGRRLADATTGFVDAAASVGCVVVRAELPLGDPAAAALRNAGFRRIQPSVHAASPRAVIRMERRLDGAAPRTLPYYAQSTWFTCGPVTLMLARRRVLADAAVDRRTEIDLWRQATTVHAPSGPGGCDPFGMACAAARMGFGVRVLASIEGPFLIGRAYGEEQRDLMRFVQAEFRAEAAERGVRTEIRKWAGADLAATLAAGGTAIVLIDQTIFHGAAIPHWVLVHGGDGGTWTIDDPWVEPDDRETDTDRFDLPVPAAELDRMAWWGTDPYRVAVLLEPKPAMT